MTIDRVDKIGETTETTVNSDGLAQTSDAITEGYLQAQNHPKAYLRAMALLDIDYSKPTEEEAIKGDKNARAFMGMLAAGEYLLFTESEDSKTEYIPMSFYPQSNRRRFALSAQVYTDGDHAYFDSLGATNPD